MEENNETKLNRIESKINRIEENIDLIIEKLNKRLRDQKPIDFGYIERFINKNCLLDEGKFITVNEFRRISKLSQKAYCPYFKSIGLRAGRISIEGIQQRVYFGIGWKPAIDI